MSSQPDFSPISRRALFKWGLGISGFCVMGGVAGLTYIRGSATRLGGLKILSDHEYRTLLSLAEALFPSMLESDEFADPARAFDNFLIDEPQWNQQDLKRALFLLEFGPVIFSARLKTFSHLNPAERLAHFDSWTQSESLLRRQIALAFRRLLCIFHYDQPAAWKEIGYDGPYVGEGLIK